MSGRGKTDSLSIGVGTMRTSRCGGSCSNSPERTQARWCISLKDSTPPDEKRSWQMPVFLPASDMHSNREPPGGGTSAPGTVVSVRSRTRLQSFGSGSTRHFQQAGSVHGPLHFLLAEQAMTPGRQILACPVEAITGSSTPVPRPRRPQTVQPHPPSAPRSAACSCPRPRDHDRLRHGPQR